MFSIVYSSIVNEIQEILTDKLWHDSFDPKTRKNVSLVQFYYYKTEPTKHFIFITE